MSPGAALEGAGALFAATLGLSGIIAVRYLLAAWVVWRMQWGRERGFGVQLNRERPTRRAIAHEIRYSLLCTPIYALPAAAAFEAFQAGGTRVYLDPGLYGWAWLPASFVLLLLIQDAHYYWTHRVLHHPRVFGWAHAGHHRAMEPSPFASFAFDPAEAALTAWLLPALVFFVPVHVGVLGALVAVMTGAAVLNHCGWEVWPGAFVRGRIGGQLITATHHTRHHTHQKTNFGLYFRLWDRLCGTDAMPPAPVASRTKP